MNQTLLPAGCYDVLPPYARLESQLDYQLLSHFEAYGYAQVSPPILEYAESLLAGRGAVLSPQVIRMMDPKSQKVMGLRADITLQIGRIATSRMTDTPRPLRLCYSGPVLRLVADATNPKRQMQQTGIELVGEDSAAADAEVILVALRALQAAGMGHITLDVNLPILIGAILAESSLDNEELSEVFEALAHKDSTKLKEFDEPACELLCELMLAGGDSEQAFKKLEASKLPESIEPELARLKELVSMLDAQKGSNVTLTLDVTERSGLDYYSGVSFAFFATEQGVELGRGGRYVIDRGSARESAIGCSLYSHKLNRLTPEAATPARVYIAAGIEDKDIEKLQDQGYVTILALSPSDAGDIRSIARSQACDYIYQDGELREL